MIVKEEVLQRVSALLNEKVDAFEKLIAETRAANNETKSSMGDKYETSREMVQQEINNLQNQLKSWQKMRVDITRIQQQPTPMIGEGSLVQTDRGWFLIAAPLGVIKTADTPVYAISSESPLAAALTGKTTGDVVTVNTMTHTILSHS